ncbi:RrF2 family transcriptional regulator [Micromonospora rubida]|uniref:RrF2 family transcriptional regulator n=1 Tax=Micromonospora rubida TaxID=2697657 RepID=UPI0013781311|nr:Rrf2 family transcriptional regulator [Micromonospora rubida]NBE83554.1 Rrf2 family transcriptional regulator [Micromonospora rubida]
MRMSQSVEWSVHCCLALAWIETDQPVSVAALSTWFDLPRAYLNKGLQALVRAGILTSHPGLRGGFRLARPPEQITLLDIVVAHEGREDAFRCTEIRQRGSGVDPAAPEFRRACAVTTAMRKADLAWRRELAAQTVADLMAAAPQAAAARTRRRHQSLRG